MGETHTLFEYNAAQQCLSNDNMPHTQELVPVKSHHAAPISTNSQGLTRKEHEGIYMQFMRAQDPLGLAFVSCTLSSVEKRGREVDTNKHTHTNTNI